MCRHTAGGARQLPPLARPSLALTEPPWLLPWPGTCERRAVPRMVRGRRQGSSSEEPPGRACCSPRRAARLKRLAGAQRCSGGGSGEGSELGSCSPPRRYHLSSHAVPAKNIAFKHGRHLQRGRRAGWLGMASHTGPRDLPGSHRHLLPPEENEDPPRVTCNTDGKQGGPH